MHRNRASNGQFARTPQEPLLYFCTCETPQPDGLYQCTTCWKLVYRDDY